MTSEHVEAVINVSTSSSSGSSTASASSTASTSSTSSTCSTGSSSSSSSSSGTMSNPTNSSSTISTSISPNSHQAIQLDEIAYDFGLIMTDLRNVCGTLNILSRQIDQIVLKIDTKFNTIIDHLNHHQTGTNITLNDNDSSDTDCQPQQSQTQQQQQRPAQFTKIYEPNNPNSIFTTDTLNRFNAAMQSMQKNVHNNFHQTTPSKLLNNANLRLKTEQAFSNLINGNTDIAYANNNNNNNKIVRALSDRKAPSLSVNDYCNNNKGEMSDVEKATNKLNLLINSNNLSTPSKTLMDYSSMKPSSTSSLKMRCTRSKSQPAFKEHANNFAASTLPTSESQKISLILASNNNNNTTTTNPLSSSSKFLDQNRLTSSPICHYNGENGAVPPGALLNDSTNAESSFYEDQLDNELESFSTTNISRTFVTSSSYTTVPVKLNPKTTTGNTTSVNNGCKTVEEAISINAIINASNNNNSENNKTNMKANNRAKTNGSNHHVSFNINNAIYTSRQETPIPISILKQNTNFLQQQQLQQQQKVSQTSTPNKSVLAAVNNEIGEKLNVNSLLTLSTSNTSSPLQSSLKKTPLLGEKDSETSANMNSTKGVRSLSNGSKCVRIDSKTTIL